MDALKLALEDDRFKILSEEAQQAHFAAKHLWARCSDPSNKAAQSDGQRSEEFPVKYSIVEINFLILLYLSSCSRLAAASYELLTNITVFYCLSGV